MTKVLVAQDDSRILALLRIWFRDVHPIADIM